MLVGSMEKKMARNKESIVVQCRHEGVALAPPPCLYFLKRTASVYSLVAQKPSPYIGK